MDETAVKKLIDDALAAGLKTGLKQFQEFFKKELAPIASRLDEFEAVVTEPSPPAEKPEASAANPETAALLERIAKMERVEQDRQAELARMKFDSTLTSTLAKHSPLHGDVVKELLAARYSAQAVEKNGEWYLPNGSKLAEEVDSFFKSDAGQHFIANPSGQSLGTTTSSKPPTTQKSLKELTSDEMMAEWSI